MYNRNRRNKRRANLGPDYFSLPAGRYYLWLSPRGVYRRWLGRIGFPLRKAF